MNQPFFCYPLTFTRRRAFNMTITAAPVSLKTAIQRVSIPGHIRVSAANFMMIENQMFRSEEHTSELQSRFELVCRLLLANKTKVVKDRNSTRVNSSVI